jgi:hypothetical protein
MSRLEEIDITPQTAKPVKKFNHGMATSMMELTDSNPRLPSEILGADLPEVKKKQ